MKIKLMVFRKKYLVVVSGPFWTQNYSASSRLHSHRKDKTKFIELCLFRDMLIYFEY